jgi:hypothetical protein
VYRLLIKSYLLLVLTHIRLSFSGLESVTSAIRHESTSSSKRQTPVELCHAMDLACVFYPRRVLCLQRSGATTLLLRRHGHLAEMVIGAQILPFKSHAWVEIDRTVVNDKPYMLDIYRPIERY